MHIFDLYYSNKESPLYMPNEIFDDLRNANIKGSRHISFAYSYYYLTSWLYRYAKYGHFKIDTKMIKQMLGFNPNTKNIDYLIKKNGVLDQIGYTISTTDYPITCNYDEHLKFTMFSELDLEARKFQMKHTGRNYKIKLPVKAIWRNKESQNENTKNGTFFNINNTHLISFERFVRCMNIRELGVTAFYIYGFLKYKCQIHKGKYNNSVERIADEIGISDTTTDKYLKLLLMHKIIGYEKGESFLIGNDINGKANTYWIEDY